MTCRKQPRTPLGSLDIVFELFPSRLPHMQQELIVGGEELPVEEIVYCPPVNREQHGADLETQLGSEGVRGDCSDLEHMREDKNRRAGPTSQK